MGGGIKRIGTNGLRAQSLNTSVANIPSRQGFLKISNLSFPIVTEWESFTPVVESFGAVSQNVARYRRVGDSIEVRGRFLAGTTVASPGAIKLPEGLQVDQSKLGSDQTFIVGQSSRGAATPTTIPATTAGPWLMTTSPTADPTAIYFSQVTVFNQPLNRMNGNVIASSGDSVNFWFEVPVAGWDAKGTGSIEDVIGSSFFDFQLNRFYPVGSIYINATFNINPSELLGFGTWQSFGSGRVMVGFDSGDPLFDAAEKIGGSKDAAVISHTHTFSGTTSSNGSHQHNIDAATDDSDLGPKGRGGGNLTTTGTIVTDSAGAHTHTYSGTTSNASSGVSGTNANLQPFITVYMWKRIS